MRTCFLLFLIGVLFLSCKSDFFAIKQNPDIYLRYRKAIEYLKIEEYDKAIELMEDIRSYFVSRVEGEELYYNLAIAHKKIEYYDLCAYYFEQIIEEYPDSKYKEEAMFQIAECYRLLSPDYNRDQQYSKKSIVAYQNYINKYPKSSKKDTINNYIKILNKKLEQKAFQIAELYYTLQNYQAAIVCYDNFLTNFIESDLNEEVWYKKNKAIYILAKNSVIKKKKERVYNAIENNQYFLNTYLDTSKYYNEIKYYLEDLEKEKILLSN